MWQMAGWKQGIFSSKGLTVVPVNAYKILTSCRDFQQITKLVSWVPLPWERQVSAVATRHAQHRPKHAQVSGTQLIDLPCEPPEA